MEILTVFIDIFKGRIEGFFSFKLQLPPQLICGSACLFLEIHGLLEFYLEFTGEICSRN